MEEKLGIALLFLLITLTACATPAAGTATPKPPTATGTKIPLTATPTPEAGIFTYEQALPLFDYDPSAPFELHVSNETEKDGVIVQEITYMAADKKYSPKTLGKILAYLVKPAKNGSYAGILYMHGLGQGWGNRKEFLDEATALAQQGVVSLLPMGLFPWMVQHTGDETQDQINVIKQVIELRRALDVLMSQPGVDPQRIAFVGHDYGAMHGALLAGIEKRVKAYILMAGDTNYADWAITYLTKPADPDRYRRVMQSLAPVNFLPHIAPAALFLQFAETDKYIPKASADEFFAAASDPKTISTYDTDHGLQDKPSSKDRVDWLIGQLNLPPAP